MTFKGTHDCMIVISALHQLYQKTGNPKIITMLMDIFECSTKQVMELFTGLTEQLPDQASSLKEAD